LFAEPALDDLTHLPLDAAIAGAAFADLRALEELLDPLSARPILAVAAFTLPSLERVIFNAIEPAPHQGIAHLDLVVEKRERQFGIEGLDPQRHTGQFDGQRVDVHAVDAPLDDVPPQQCLHAVGEHFAPVGIIGREWQQFVALVAVLWAAVGQRDSLCLPGIIQLPMVAERLVKGLGQIVQRATRNEALPQAGSQTLRPRISSGVLGMSVVA